MSDQFENETQQTLSPEAEEARQRLLAEIEAGRMSIEELSDEELELVSGGFTIHFFKQFARVAGTAVGISANITTKIIK